MEVKTPEPYYRNRLQDVQAMADRQKRRLRWLSLARILSFTGVLFAAYSAYQASSCLCCRFRATAIRPMSSGGAVSC